MESSNDQDSVVLLIGTVDREGVLSAIKSSGLRYSVKRIDSTPKNWKTICERFKQGDVACVLMKLTPTTYHYLGSDSYAAVRDELLQYVAKTRHAIYIYEDLLAGVDSSESTAAANIEDIENEIAGYEDLTGQHITQEEFFRHHFAPPGATVRQFVNDLLAERGLEVIPYRTNAELSVLATKFIDDTDGGLLFRVYLPADRIWAHETDRLLTLFRDYLGRVGHENITLNQTRTAHGIIYEFFAARHGSHSDSTCSIDLPSEFSRFSSLLDTCLKDNAEAGRMLAQHGVSPHEISTLLARYSKEAKRLQVDLRQEREQKVLTIRHRLESELVDQLPAQVPPDLIAELVNLAVPPAAGVSGLLTGGASPVHVTATQGSTVVFNHRPQIVSSLNAIVAQEIAGGVHLTNEDNRILQLIREHAAARVLELESAVRQVADESVPKPDRLLSARRLKGFLFQLAAKLPDVGIGLLQAYLEKRLGL